MARRFNMVVLVVMALAALLQSSAAQTTHVVGDSTGWVIPPGGPTDYTTWAATKTFTVGDTLVFNFTSGLHSVAEVTKAAFGSCNSTSPISISTNGPTKITLKAAGEHYYICTINSHCDFGQKLAINVTATASSPAPQPSTPSPASAPTPTPSRAAVTYHVGDSIGWIVPPGGPVAYQTWAFNKIFMVGDTLVFNFTNRAHDVAEVTKAAFESCNTTTTISHITTSPARITLSTAGEHYYTCTFSGHCSMGQQLAINVTAGSATPPSTSTTPTTPTTPSSPTPAGSATAPPPGNSATSFAAGLFATFLSVAIALLY